MKSKAIIATILLLTAFVFAPAAQSVPDEFVTVFNDIAVEFDPHRSIYSNEAQIFTALYEGLFAYDAAGLAPMEAAVRSWKKSKDGLVYTFTIRDDAAWSDGSPLLAEHFRSAWIRILKLNAQYAAFFDVISGAHDFRLGITKDENSLGIRAESAKTLVVSLNRPTAYFTRLLCHHSFSPIHPSMLADDAGAWAERIPYPVNGPYRFVAFENGRLSLEKNPHYWDKRSVSMEKLTMLFTDDDQAATRMFNSEEAHWLAGPGDYDGLFLQEAIQANPIFSTHYWYFNCRKEPWNKESVRRALALLLPWKEIRDSSVYMVPAETLVLPLPGYSEAQGISARNKDEALKLLEAAGYPEGKGLPELKIYFAESRDNRRVLQLFQTAWKVLPEFKVSLLPLAPSRYYQFTQSPEGANGIGMAHTTWIGDFADPEAFLQMWTPGSSLNEAGFDDPAFMELLTQSYEKDGEKRMSLLAEAESLLLGKAVVLPIYHGFASSIIDLDYIEGWYQNALDIHPYKDLRFGSPSIGPNVANAAGPAH